mmetsp:Transcript_29050/g.38708  ORF Transcript_29050/g.38708 Transcript_29050/m.38708 type:complete len:173 (-) Transcript_29050:66-584(-)
MLFGSNFTVGLCFPSIIGFINVTLYDDSQSDSYRIYWNSFATLCTFILTYSLTSIVTAMCLKSNRYPLKALQSWHCCLVIFLLELALSLCLCIFSLTDAIDANQDSEVTKNCTLIAVSLLAIFFLAALHAFVSAHLTTNMPSLQQVPRTCQTQAFFQRAQFSSLAFFLGSTI